MPNYQDRLRRLAFNDVSLLEEEIGVSHDLLHLDPKTLSLVRLSALVAVAGTGPSFGEHADAALSAGASTDELVDVLIAVSAVVGVPRVVSAASSLALALGVDVDVDVLGE